MCGHQVPLLVPIQHLLSGRAAAKKARLLQHNHAAPQPASTPRLASNSGPEAESLPGGGASETCGPVCSTSSVGSYQPYPGSWAAAIPSIVLVSVLGSGWASGIVMNEGGFILTNAHVIQPSFSSSPHNLHNHDNDSHQLAVCSLRLSGSNAWHVADIIYVFKHVLDLAVLRIRDAPDSLHLQAAVLQRHAVSAGQRIAVVGHALFSPTRNMRPSITAGNVSKVLSSAGQAVLFLPTPTFARIFAVRPKPHSCIGQATAQCFHVAFSHANDIVGCSIRST